MSVAESINYSPLELTSGVVAMTVANGGGVPKERVKGVEPRIGSPRNVVFASASPKLNGSASGLQERGRATLLSLNGMLDTLETADLSTLDADEWAVSAKQQMAQVEKLLGGNVPVIRMLMEQLDAPSAEEEPVQAAPPPPEPQESFQGTSIGETNDNLVTMAGSMNAAQISVTETMTADRERTQAMSDQSIASIQGNRDLQIANIDKQTTVTEKQHFWKKLTTGLKYAATIIGGAIATFLTGNPMFLAMAIVMVTMQILMNQTGLQEMIDNLGPVARVFAEIAVLVAIVLVSIVATAGVGAALEAGTVATEAAASAGIENGVGTGVGTGVGAGVGVGAEAGAGSAENVMSESVSSTLNYAKSGAIAGAGAGMVSSGLVNDLAWAWTELFFIGNEDNKKAKKIVQSVLEVILSIIFTVSTMAIAGGTSTASASSGSISGKATLGLMGGTTALELLTSALGIYSSSIGLRLADLQKEYGEIQANLQQAQSMNELALDQMETNQKMYSDLLQSMISSFQYVLEQITVPFRAAAQAV